MTLHDHLTRQNAQLVREERRAGFRLGAALFGFLGFFAGIASASIFIIAVVNWR